MTYRPELDAFRGIAVLLVIGGHFLVPGMQGGSHVGVTIFFVLSGYLITSILRQGGGLRRFYSRRARRLLPALLVWVGVIVVAGVVSVSQALPTLLYVANWAAIDGGLAKPLGHTWSLAVEEQFYLAWPLVLLAIRRPVWLLWAVIGGSAALRLLWPTNDVAIVASRFDALAWGCLLGLGVQPRIPFAAAATASAILALFAIAGPPGGDPAEFTVTGAAAFIVLGYLVRRATGPLAIAPLMAVGRISYGLYLWHFPIALALQRQLYTFDGRVLTPTPGRVDDIVWTAAAIALTFACAGLSWLLVERRFLASRPRQLPLLDDDLDARVAHRADVTAFLPEP